MLAILVALLTCTVVVFADEQERVRLSVEYDLNQPAPMLNVLSAYSFGGSDAIRFGLFNNWVDPKDPKKFHEGRMFVFGLDTAFGRFAFHQDDEQRSMGLKFDHKWSSGGLAVDLRQDDDEQKGKVRLDLAW